MIIAILYAVVRTRYAKLYLKATFSVVCVIASAKSK